MEALAWFGMTSLLGDWLAEADAGRPTAWVSLDERDADPLSFWSYVLLAVDRAIPGTATAGLALLRAGQSSIEDVLTALVNELGVAPNDLNVVLDDYHLVDTPGIQAGLGFLLDHLPPQVHLLISTRADPALPLARLRARGQLVEIRGADLRFNSNEAASYLNQVNSLALGPAEVAALEARTEGWPAALQLAALSLQGRSDHAKFITGFAGDDRFVVDYLADEVLDRLPAEVRRFFLDTSVLDRMTGSLCDAVTGRADGKSMLESLERQNLFVIALDDQRRWYRYHHLFADVLRTRLPDEGTGDASVLHRRASDWYDRAGDPEAAVRHALAGGHVELAADRVEAAIPDLQRGRREAVMRRWAEKLPADIVKNRPVLAVGLIGALMSSNEFHGVEQRLRHAEQLLNAPVQDLRIVDHKEFARLPVAVETYRAALALVAGDLPGTIHHAELARGRADTSDHLSIAAASALVGLASWTTGDLEAAHGAYRLAIDNLERAGHVADVLGCALTLADIEMAQGRLGDAQATLEYALALATTAATTAEPLLRGVADMYVGLGRVSLEQGDDAAAADYLRRADEAGDSAGLPQNPYRWRVMTAHLREAEGDTAAAVELLEEAERVYVGDFSPNVRPVAASRARVLAAAGDLAGAKAWARRWAVSAADDLTYLREYDHLTLARVLLAEHSATGSAAALAEATGLLGRLAAAAQDGGRVATLIEALVLQALADRAAGKTEPALKTLAHAMTLAEPEMHIRAFTHEGEPMDALLAGLARRHRDNAFARRLLQASAASRARTGLASATTTEQPEGVGAAGSGGGTVAGQYDPPVLVDALSGRELDVLRLLASELGGPDIARELHVSLSTVRTHTQRIYAKLGVNNRRAAVRRAHQLNVFARGTHR
jgi:LuxR family maltose regulon positive regulatory protein